MANVKNIEINKYTYNLPENYIAFQPLTNRDKSKLLISDNGKISEDIFANVYKYIPENSLTVFNDTRVVPARLIFFKDTGARIEIFCLKPVENATDMKVALSKHGKAQWECMVGNAKKWKEGELTLSVPNDEITLKAKLIEKKGDIKKIEFSWQPAKLTFVEILEVAGKTPLPPYITREAYSSDKNNYQTIYAKNNGSVAAPTAGLHFTSEVINSFKPKNIETTKLTLHVGAGTFKPVSEKTIGKHNMHAENIVVPHEAILKLKNYADNNIVSVGTTAMRTLETIYWWGVKLINGYMPEKSFFELSQWFPYDFKGKTPSFSESLDAILNFIKKNNLSNIKGKTELIIVPGYKFKTTNILITNFHQPKSTLLLLIAAFAGDEWEKVYEYALNNKFRFLSYGDSCIFTRKTK